MSIWFTSDTHFNHQNVIKYCNRPWTYRKEMDEALIANWNARVRDGEMVYVLGDFSFAGKEYTRQILARLKGTKILILGNHDKDAQQMLDLGFDKVYENIFIELNPGKVRVFLSHFPYHPMTRYHKNSDGSVVADDVDLSMDRRYLHKRIVDDGESWLLHGHVHTSWRQNGRQINVGVDQWNYAPISHEKILKIIEDGEKFDGKSRVDDGD